MAFVYPDSWSDLNVAPIARFELTEYVKDVVEWNAPNSVIRNDGTADLIGFLFDDYDIAEGFDGLVGHLIFGDELEDANSFASEFDRFLTSWQRDDNHLTRLHTASILDTLVAAAANFNRTLAKRGLPVER
jgi:hypothetical protein